MKKRLFAIILLALTTLVAACGGSQEAAQSAAQTGGESASATQETIKVGVTGGPHEEIMNKVKEVAQAQGLNIEVVVFNDYVLPNRALHSGEIDLNSFQTIPFLEKFNEDHGTNIVPIGKNVTFPMGLYSTKYKSVDEVPEGGIAGIQNDPTQRARALELYQEAGLIKLKEGVELPTPLDIVENPKNLQFKELEAPFLARSLNNFDIASINTNFAMEAGYSPKDDAIFSEGPDSPYVNVIAARAEDKDNPTYLKLVEIYRSEEVKKFIEENFDGSVLPSW